MVKEIVPLEQSEVNIERLQFSLAIDVSVLIVIVIRDDSIPNAWASEFHRSAEDSVWASEFSDIVEDRNSWAEEFDVSTATAESMAEEFAANVQVAEDDASRWLDDFENFDWKEYVSSMHQERDDMLASSSSYQYCFAQENHFLNDQDLVQKGLALMKGGHLSDAILAFEAEVQLSKDNLVWHASEFCKAF